MNSKFLELIEAGRVIELGDYRDFQTQKKKQSLDNAREKIAKSPNQTSLVKLIEAFKDAPDDVEISGK